MHGGHMVAGNDSFTWVVMVMSLVSGQVRLCSGSIIADDAVLTAAHCFPPMMDPSRVLVRTFKKGMYDDFVGKSIQTHPEFVDKVRNDLAVVRVKSSKLGTKVNWKRDVPLVNCEVAGFGEKGLESITAKEETLGILTWMSARPIPSQLCSRRLPVKDAICWPTFLGVGPCVGDSGGPMACQGTLVGVLSRGFIFPANSSGCGRDSHAVMIYEDTHKHKDWIKDTLSITSGGLQGHLSSLLLTANFVAIKLKCV